MTSRQVRYRADYLWETPDDGNRYEVIDGELYVTPPPTWLHQQGSGNLYGHLWQYIRPRRLGFVVAAPVGVVLDDENGIQPDLVYVSNDRARIITNQGIVGAPDLVVEVLSPSTQRRDRGIKMRRYAAAGVPHYWMLVPRSRTLEAYRLGPNGYELVGIFGPEDVFRPDLFPGLEIPIRAIWT